MRAPGRRVALRTVQICVPVVGRLAAHLRRARDPALKTGRYAANRAAPATTFQRGSGSLPHRARSA